MRSQGTGSGVPDYVSRLRASIDTHTVMDGGCGEGRDELDFNTGRRNEYRV